MTKKKFIQDFFTFWIIIFLLIIYLSNLALNINMNFDVHIVITFAIIGVITIYNIFKDKRKYSLNKTFWYFNLFFFFIAPIMQYLSNYFPWGYYIDSEIYFESNIYLILWLLIYSFTYKLTKDTKETTNISIGKIDMKFLMICTIVALILLISLIGLSNLLTRETNTIENIDDAMIQSLVDKILRSVPAISTVIYFINVQKNNKKINIFYILIFFIATIISVFPTSVTRYFMGTVYIGIVLSIFEKKMNNRTFDLGMIAVFAILFPMFQIFKWYTLSDIIESGFNFQMFDGVYNNVDFDAYSMFSRIILYVDRFGFTHGNQILCTLLFFIPRRFWNSKPISTGPMVATAQDVNFTNLSSPLISEGYIDFGIFGVILYAIIIAFILKKLDTYYWQKKEQESTIDIVEIVYPFLIGFLIFMLRGSLQPTVVFMFSFFVYVFGIYFLFKKKREKKWKR